MSTKARPADSTPGNLPAIDSKRRDESIGLAIAAVVLAALFLPPSLVEINIFDEGFIVSGSMLVRDGKLPYRDFFSMYGPGQYMLNAGLYGLFGEALLVVRYLHVFILTSIGLALFVITNRITPGREGRPWLILCWYAGIVLVSNPSPGYPAITATLTLLLSACVLSVPGSHASTARLMSASGLIGLTGVLRWDFGLFGLVAFVAAILCSELTNPKTQAGTGRLGARVLSAIVPALASWTVVYGLLLFVTSSPERWFREVLLYSLEYGKWREIEFLRPAFWGLSSGDPKVVIRSLIELAHLAIPIVAIVTAGGIVGRHALKGRGKEGGDGSIVLVFLLICCLLLLNQMRVRPTLWQGYPAMVIALPLLFFVANRWREQLSRHRILQVTGQIGVFLAGAILFGAAFQVVIVAHGNYFVPLNTPRGAGIRVLPEMKHYGALVDYVVHVTKEDEPIFSGVRDHSRLLVNDAMLYFMTGRPPADRFLELDPGVANTRAAQAEIAQSLDERDVRVVVLLDLVSNEANLSAVSNGVDTLDTFIRKHYRYDRSFGNSAVFLKR